VKYAGGAPAARALIAARGAKVAREVPPASLMMVTGLSAADAAALSQQTGIARVLRDELVTWIPSPATFVRSKVALTSGPSQQGTDQSGAFFYDAFQWNMKVTEANVAWGTTPGGLGETVCVLDTGVDPIHNDLIGKVDPTRSASAILVPRFASDTTVLDFNFHGTYISSIVSSNGIGVASVAPDANLCAIKVLSQDGFGSFGDIIFAIYLAASRFGADVINMSLGAIVDSSNPNNAGLLYVLQEVIDFARNRGALVVAASGNNGLNLDDFFPFIHIPSGMKNVISVGATGPINQQNFDRLASYSNYGGQKTLDMVAPGGEFIPGLTVQADLVISACSHYQVTLPFSCATNSYVLATGTSGATAHVSGAGAVVESNATGGNLPIKTLEACILDQTDKLLPKWKFGRGRLNVAKAAFCEGKI
jgi:subtilisin family serine protease